MSKAPTKKKAPAKKAPVHGYSGKTLGEKLGVKPDKVAIALNTPAHYDTLFDGDAPKRGARGNADLVHLFCADRAAFAKGLTPALARVNDGGMLWVSWPKKGSKLFKDMTEDDIRAAVLPIGWVDVKVCAVDADWSGLKIVRRKK